MLLYAKNLLVDAVKRNSASEYMHFSRNICVAQYLYVLAMHFSLVREPRSIVMFRSATSITCHIEHTLKCILCFAKCEHSSFTH